MFFALCTPIEMRGDLNPGHHDNSISTMSFSTKHSLDMRIIDTCDRLFCLLGYTTGTLLGETLYNLVHPEFMFIAQDFHNRALSLGEASKTKSGCSCTLQLLTADNHTVTTLVTATRPRQDVLNSIPSILCQYQIVSDDMDDQSTHRLLIGSHPSSVVKDNMIPHQNKDDFEGPYSHVYRDEGYQLSDLEPDEASLSGRLNHFSGEMPAIHPVPSSKPPIPPHQVISGRVGSTRRNSNDGNKHYDSPHELKETKSGRMSPRRYSPYQRDHLDSGNSSCSVASSDVQETTDWTYIFNHENYNRETGKVCVISTKRAMPQFCINYDGDFTLTSRGMTPEEDSLENRLCKAPNFATLPQTSRDIIQQDASACALTISSCSHRPVFSSSENGSLDCNIFIQAGGRPEISIQNEKIRGSCAPRSYSLENLYNGRPTPPDVPTTSSLYNQLKRIRAGSMGNGSFEKSISAALESLNSDQMHLLDQATSSLVDPY